MKVCYQRRMKTHHAVVFTELMICFVGRTFAKPGRDRLTALDMIVQTIESTVLGGLITYLRYVIS
jgi:hypothetical protein